MPHPSEHHDVTRPLGPEEADELAEVARLFGTGSRLRLLWAMLDGERTVEELGERTGLEQSAISHQLRILRQGRLVRVRRAGRHAHYRLYDHHVTDLLAAIRYHREHLDPGPGADVPRAEREASR